MASFLEKMGLVERVDKQEDFDSWNENDAVPDYEETEELPEVNTEGVSQENLIVDIYAANDLSDVSSSVFKVEEITKSLPATMTNEAKKASVVGILGSFNLTVPGLLFDAEERNGILLAAAAQITEDNTAIINERKAQIEEAKNLIATWEASIAEHEQIIATSTDTIEAEVKRITALKEFLGGNE